MATLETSFLQTQLDARKQRLEQAIALAPRNSALANLLREVDAALERMAKDFAAQLVSNVVENF